MASLALLLAACGGSSSRTTGTLTSSVGGKWAIPPGPITLCASAPESGANAAYGETIPKAEAIDVNIINSQYGGIDGHKVRVDVENDQSSSTEGVAIAQKFVSEHQAHPNDCPFLTTISQDPETAPIQAAIFNKAEMIDLATQSPNAFFNVKQFPYFFSNSPPDIALSNVAAHYLMVHHLDKIAVLTDNIPQETEYINGIISQGKSMGAHLTIIKTASISPGAVNAETELAELQASHPDVLLVATEFGFGPIWANLHSMNWDPKIMGDVGFFYDGYNALGSLGPNAVAPCWYGNPAGVLNYQSLPANVLATINQTAPINGGEAPDSLIGAADGVDELLMARYAIDKAGSLYPPALKAALETLHGPNASLWFKGNLFDESSSSHSGQVGAFGAGICQAAPLGKVANYPNFVYADSYRAPGNL